MRRWSRRTLCLSLCGWVAAWVIPGGVAAESNGGWPHGLRLDDLVVHADYPLQPIEHDLRSLGDLRRQLAQHLKYEIPARPVHIYLFRDRATYHDYVGRQFPTAPQRPALYVGTPTHDCLLAAQGPQLMVDLRHELTHSLLHRRWPNLPLWLDEGLAEYFEQADARKHPTAARWRELARSGQFPSADPLWSQEDPDRLRIEDYALAYAWTRFLLESPTVDPAMIPRLLGGDAASHGRPADGLSAQLLSPLSNQCQHFWSTADYNTEGDRRPPIR